MKKKKSSGDRDSTFSSLRSLEGPRAIIVLGQPARAGTTGLFRGLPLARGVLHVSTGHAEPRSLGATNLTAAKAAAARPPARLGRTQQSRQGPGRRSARAWDAEGLRAVVAKVRTSWKMSSGHAPQRPLSDPKPTLWSRQPGGMGPEHCRAPHAQRGP